VWAYRTPIANSEGWHPWSGPFATEEQAIEAAHGACEGIADPGGLAELVEAASLTAEALSNGATISDSKNSVYGDLLRSALARVKGERK